MNSKTLTQLTWAVVLLGFGYLFGITFIPLAATGLEFAKTGIGFILGTALGTLINYIWGAAKKENSGEK